MDVIEMIIGADKESKGVINIANISGLCKAVDKVVASGEFKKLPRYRIVTVKDRKRYIVELIESPEGDYAYYLFEEKFSKAYVCIEPYYTARSFSTPVTEIPIYVVYEALLNYAMDHFPEEG